jgi:hypothetical protein
MIRDRRFELAALLVMEMGKNRLEALGEDEGLLPGLVHRQPQLGDDRRGGLHARLPDDPDLPFDRRDQRLARRGGRGRSPVPGLNRRRERLDVVTL